MPEKKMAAIWSDENKFQKWLDVEIAACQAHVVLGNITQCEFDDIKSKANFNVDRILEIESEVHHDVIAFLTCVAEYVGPNSRLIHLGLTSSDVVDTAFALLIKESGLQLYRR
jgi:adenylosuccinate lyase